MTKSPRIAFIKARWHADVVDRAHEGFLTQAASLMPGAQIEAWTCPAPSRCRSWPKLYDRLHVTPWWPASGRSMAASIAMISSRARWSAA